MFRRLLAYAPLLKFAQVLLGTSNHGPDPPADPIYENLSGLDPARSDFHGRGLPLGGKSEVDVLHQVIGMECGSPRGGYGDIVWVFTSESRACRSTCLPCSG